MADDHARHQSCRRTLSGCVLKPYGAGRERGWRRSDLSIEGDSGFARVHGELGSGKSVVMRLLAERLARLADLSVGVIHHPQSNLSDFYRELGDIFGISIRVSNRWGGFKALRASWLKLTVRSHSPALRNVTVS